MNALIWLILAAAGLIALHRAALAAERRGWIRYRDGRGRAAALGNALLEVHAILEPSKRFTLEERLRDPSQHDDDGDPPEGGRDGSKLRA